MRAALTTLVEGFEVSPPKMVRSMRQLADQDPAAFVQAAGELLVTMNSSSSRGRKYLLSLLISQELILPLLSTMDTIPLADAKKLALETAILDPTFEREIARFLQDRRDTLPQAAICRLLDMLIAISDPDRVVGEISPLLQHADSRVRSKVIIFLGRGHRHLAWFVQQMRQSDPRVRANAVESLWSDQDTRERRVIYTVATRDVHNRVVANGWIGFYRLGAVESIAGLLGMLTDERPQTRASGAWAAGSVKDNRFSGILQSLMEDADLGVRKNARRARKTLTEEHLLRSAAGGIRIETARPVASSLGRRTYLVSAVCEREFVGGLRPTDFALKTEAGLITEYLVRPVLRPELLLLEFIFPVSVIAAGVTKEPLKAMLDTEISRCARGEAWHSRPYLTGEQRMRRLLVSDHAQPAFEGGEDSAVHSEELPRGPIEALRDSLRLLPPKRATRRLLLVCTGPADSLEGLDTLESELTTSQSVLDIVAAPHAPPELLALAAKTGGRCITTEIADLAESLRSLIHGVHSGYEVTFSELETPVFLSVSTAQGWGETLLP